MSKLVVVIGIVAVAGGIFALKTMEEEPAAAPSKAVAGPPAGAQFTHDSPETIIKELGAAKKGARDSVADSFCGLWVPAAGWEGEVIAADRSGFRIRRFDPTLIGGECFVTARCDHNPEVKVGQVVRVQGRIKDVSSKPSVASVSHNIELEQSRVVR